MQTSPEQGKSKSRRNLGIAIGIVVILAVIVVVAASSAGIGIVQKSTVTTVTSSTATVESAVSNNIVNAVVTVGARTYESYQINVPDGATGITVTGSFTASGGSGNDIEVFVLDSIDYTNWVNGHQVSAYYDSGQVTTNTLNVQLPGSGTYYLVYSNTFSLLSSKDVNTQVNLNYQIPVQTVVMYTTSYVTS